MKEDAKDSALRALSLFLLVASLAGLVWGWSVYKKTSNTAPTTTMTISAEGKVTVKPDLAIIDFSVVTQGDDPKSVQKINDGKMGAVVKYLQESGIEEKDIKTTAYNLSPQYNYSWCNNTSSDIYCPPKIVSYILTQGVEVKLRDLIKSGEIIGNLPSKGANTISSISFTMDDLDIPRIEARKEAVEKANNKAEMMAKAAGVKLGKIANISESSGYTPYYSYSTKSAEYDSGIGGGAPSPIQVGSNEITVNVSITYQIK